MTSATGGLLAGLPFQPDRFQIDAAAAIADGETVVVTAPTGAGKTVIAEAAIRHARAASKRAFYTTPIKALSNQKFTDLQAEWVRVGLLTGDNSVDGAAPVVVMTTEVLRNMIYAGSDDLADVQVVVLDEVHYLGDRFRGPVWEEVLIHAPRHIQFVCLSATVANAGEFRDWIEARRGPTRLIQETNRPVPLHNLYAVRDLFEEPLHPYTEALISSLPTLEDKKKFIGIPGLPPRLLDLPSGCVFHPRCPKAMDKCKTEVPRYHEVKPNRWARCHLYPEKTGS